MISFEDFSIEEGRPIYLQIMEYIKRGAAAGTVHDGDELPSRRVMSALLGINPNTVQKAYRQLEEEGLVESRTGAKSYVRIDEKMRRVLREELLKEQLRRTAATMKQMGVSLEQALGLLSKYWD